MGAVPRPGGGARAACLAAALALAPAAARAQNASDLARLSIEELANVQVTSISRRTESLSEAAAAAYVITHEEILRSGARTLPEILRLAPNLLVAQTRASDYQISARGLAGSPTFQDFSNKLLVLIDGRSVYTPLFSGVYWDLIDVLPEDIERVEVISGPAGTLWGANAVNGVVNVITRSADASQGGYAVVSDGPLQRDAGLRYGGRALGGSYRVYAHALQADDFTTAAGQSERDRFARVQGGFRFDWAPGPRDAVSLHGDLLAGGGPTEGAIASSNLVADYTRTDPGGGAFRAQAYFDEERRGHDATGGLPLLVDTVDLDLQQTLVRGPHQLVFGGGGRASAFHITALPNFSFQPSSAVLGVADLFAEDTIRLAPSLRLVAGLKLENDPYTGWTPLPNLRLAWTPAAGALLWTGASRAVRSATPFDVDVRERVGGALFLAGDPAFRPERVWAFELGTRLQPNPRLSLAATLYANLYEDLRSIETTPRTTFPLLWGNGAYGRGYGLEAWARYRILPFWKVGASVNLLSETLRYHAGSAALGGRAEIADDPRSQAKLSTSLDLPFRASFDAELRRQSALPAPRVPAYTELDLRLAYPLTNRLEVAVAGRNLLHERHVEFSGGEPVPRMVFGELRCRF